MQATLSVADILSFLYAALLVYDALVPSNPPILHITLLVLWALLVMDFCWRFLKAPNKVNFLRNQWIDCLLLVFPPLRLLRAMLLLRLLRIARCSVAVSRVFLVFIRFLKHNGFAYVLGIFAFIIVFGGWLIYTIESENAKSSIKDFWVGLWCAFISATTIGYGDFFPITWMGRFFIGIIALFGSAFFGYLGASIVSFIMKEEQERNVMATLERMEKDITALKMALERLTNKEANVRDIQEVYPVQESVPIDGKSP